MTRSGKQIISVTDRIISVLSYLSAGFVGFIYCIVLLYFFKKNPSNFVRFNVIQSIFFALLYYILSIVIGFVFNLLSHIPLIQLIVAWLQLIFFTPYLFGLSLVQLIVNGFVLYFVVMSLLGRYPVVYRISSMLNSR